MSTEIPAEPLSGEAARGIYQKEVEVAQRALNWLRSTEYQKERAEYADELQAAIRDSQPSEQDRREIAYNQLKALDEIEARLQRRVETGKLAAESLNELDEEKTTQGDGAG